MYTLDYKLPFSTIALIHEADYVAKIHFNFTYVSFLSLGVDWTNLSAGTSSVNLRPERTRIRTRMRTHAQASGCAHDSNIKLLEK